MRASGVEVEKAGIHGAPPSPVATKSRRQTHPSQNGPRIEDLDILAVWHAVGGGPLRANYGRAFWRGGDGRNIRLYPDTGTWRDFARDLGGGILALVGIAFGLLGPIESIQVPYLVATVLARVNAKGGGK